MLGTILDDSTLWTGEPLLHGKVPPDPEAKYRDTHEYGCVIHRDPGEIFISGDSRGFNRHNKVKGDYQNLKNGDEVHPFVLVA